MKITLVSDRKNPKSNYGGYTLLETLIFLVISMTLLVSAITLISGQQGRAEFTYGIREFASQISDIANDVSTGYYHNPNNFMCNLNGSGEPRFTYVGEGNGQQGENIDCIFVGKVLQLAPDTSRSNETFRIYTVVGRRQIVAPPPRRDVINISESFTVPLTNSYCSGCSAANTQLISEKLFANGMEVKWARINGDICQSVGSIGFFSNFISYKPPLSADDEENSELAESDSSSTNVIPITSGRTCDNGDTGFGKSVDETSLLIHDRTKIATPNPTGGIVLCIESGSGGYYALMNLGGNLRQLSNSLNIQRGTCP